MNEKFSNVDNLIFDYLSGSLSDENRKKIEKLFSQSEELGNYFKELTVIWNGVSGSEFAYNYEFAFSRFKKLVGNDWVIKKQEKRISRLNTALRIAGIILLMFVVCSALFMSGRKYPVNSKMVSVKCSAGEKSKITLPDGSQVWLNSESVVSYGSDFGLESRDVNLIGEACFKVKSDKNNPFNVFVNDVRVTATGTVFNVKAYSDENCVETSLIDGVVNMSDKNFNYKIKAGEVLSLNSETKKWTKKKIDNNDLFIGWMEGKLIFKNEALSSLIRKFERFYDVDFITDQALDTIRFSGTIQYETVDELLNILKETQGITAKKEGKEIYLNMNNN